MSFSSLKKIFRINKNKKTHKSSNNDQIVPMQVKHLEVFRPIPHLIIQKIEDVKSTLTGNTFDLDQKESTIKHQQFHKKLNLLVKDLQQNVLIQEYVRHVYSEDEQMVYNLTVKELSQTCDELSSQLKNMSFYNIRNSRVAEMINEIDQMSKQHEEKRRQVCIDVELALKKRITHKWTILKTLKDKQQLEKLLNEIIGHKNAIKLRQKQAARILTAMHAHASKNKYHQRISSDDVTAITADNDFGDRLCDGSTTAVMSDSPVVVVGQSVKNNNLFSFVAPDVGSSTVDSSQVQSPTRWINNRQVD